MIAAYVEGTNFRTLVEEFWKEHGRELIDETYSSFAFDSNDGARTVFLQRGLADVLQNDPDLVRNVAAISLGASAEMTPEMLAAACGDIDLDPLGTIRKAEELWPFADFPLVSIDDDGFLSSAL